MQDFGLIVTAGHAHPDCPVHIDRKFEDYFAIQLMVGGSLYFQREGHQRVEIAQPTFFWTDRVSNYRYGPGKTGMWDHNWISYTGSLSDSYYLPLLESLAPQGYVPVSNGEHLKRAFDDMYRLIHSTAGHFEKVHQMNRILARVDQGRPRPDRPNDRIQEIKDGIDMEPQLQFDFAKLAEGAGHSYSNFRRIFRERYASAPHNYLLRRRMQLAAELLTQTYEGIQQIGFWLGYEDPARFSRVFKQHHGLSPRAYRRSSLQLFGGN